MVDDEDAVECSHCGSFRTQKVEDVDARSENVPRLDFMRSGFYLCERCGGESYHEIELPTKFTPRYPLFSKSLRCECGSWDVGLSMVNVNTKTRTHSCKRCKRKWFSAAIDCGGVPSEESPAFSPTARCPLCHSYKTYIEAVRLGHNYRQHRCNNCNRGFRTSMSDRR